MGIKNTLLSLFKQESAPADHESASMSEADKKTADEIAKWMRNEKPYREQGYSRQVCAVALGMPEHKLSKLLNQHHQKNFNEFVNYFRVEEAKMRLVDEPKSTAKLIAFETGFSSIASFNRVFKEMTGMSPTQYRTSHT